MWSWLGKIGEFFSGLFSKKPEENTSFTFTKCKDYDDRYALLIGLNMYENSANNLKGCVNDVIDIYNYIIKNCGYRGDNIKVLLNSQATRAGMLEGLEWLVTRPDKSKLLWHYSGHGSQTVDMNNDEGDRLDEILVPYDMDWSNPLTDDVIATYFKRIPNNSFLTFLSDSCHSGTITRAVGNVSYGLRYIAPPQEIQEEIASMPPHKINKLGVKGLGWLGRGDITYANVRHMLLSGCGENQTSADAYIDGKWQGAFTSSFIKALENRVSTWAVCHDDVCAILKQGGFTQVPQLYGPKEVIENSVCL